MIFREKFESEFYNLFANDKLGGAIYAPLAGGYLTGKYLNGIDESSRLGTGISNFPKSVVKSLYYDRFHNQTNIDILKNLEVIAKELNCNLA